MSIFLNALLALLTLTYPFAVYYGLDIIGVRGFSLILLALFSFRILANPTQRVKKHSLLLLAVMAVFTLYVFSQNSAAGLRLYPLIINSVFLIAFFYSLFTSESMIERFARLQEPELPPSGVAYTRKVTIVWCLFFLINGLISLYTAVYCDIRTWSYYNGFIAYLMMGALFALEFITRHFSSRKKAQPCA